MIINPQNVQPPAKKQTYSNHSHTDRKAILSDIAKIEDALKGSSSADYEKLHKYLDGKYQHCIAGWGMSMWGYVIDRGFRYSYLSPDALKDNLSMMKPKLEAFLNGWNSTTSLSNGSQVSAPDVNVTVNNNVTVNISFEQVLAQIEDMTSLTDEQTEEAKEKVLEIQSVVNSNGSKKSKWEKIKPILVWLADKSFDVAMTILPLLLKVQG